MIPEVPRIDVVTPQKNEITTSIHSNNDTLVPFANDKQCSSSCFKLNID
jgi:hypothetical protein